MDSLTLGDSTTEIAANAFHSSTIGGDVLKLGKVETIGSYAFSEMRKLPATVIVPETATYYNNHVFFNVKGGQDPAGIWCLQHGANGADPWFIV